MIFKKTLLKIFILFFLFLLTLVIKDSGCQFAEKANGDKKKTLSERDAANVFRPNETIKFAVFSNGIKVGSGTLVYHGVGQCHRKKAQHVTFEVSTFSIKDSEDIYGQLDFSSPIRVERNVKFLGRQEAIVEEYTEDKRSVLISKSINNSAATHQIINAEKELNNVLLLIYKLRNDKELKVGKNYKINLPTNEFNLIVKDQRKVKVPLGSFDEAYYIESSPPKYKIWLSSQAERIPIRIQGLVAAGLVYLAATEINHQT